MASSDYIGGALHNSPSPVSSDSFPEHEHPQYGLLEESLEDSLGPEESQTSAPKRKSRRPPSTAERRATHNAVERARRESLNGRFMELASVLPNMANVKRPSKSVIVVKSLEFVQGVQSREQYLMGQNDALRSEINELRSRLGMPALSGSPIASLAGPMPLVNPNRERKASSVSSSNGPDSPHMSTPSSLGGSFDQPPPFAFNPAYGSAFPSAATPQPGPNNAAGRPGNNKEPAPAPATGASYNRPGHGPMDINYMMALSLQQQQQQHNMLSMHQQQQQQQGLAGAPGYHVAPWLMAHHHAAPLTAGGEAQWQFN